MLIERIMLTESAPSAYAALPIWWGRAICNAGTGRSSMNLTFWHELVDGMDQLCEPTCSLEMFRCLDS